MTAFRASRDAVAEPEELRGMMTDSRVVAAGIIVSRVTGFARVSVTAAVLGPTYFGNLFQATAVLPSAFYGLLMGTLISALLVPPLVRRVRSGSVESVRGFANSALGLMLVVLVACGVMAMILAPVLLWTFGAGADATGRDRHWFNQGLPLLLMMSPQIALYGIAGAGAAVQQAHGRFALAAVAPAVESLSIVAVMGASAALFGMGVEFGTVTMPQLVLLGAGTTAAVALHAAAQWWGAYRLGVPLMPSIAWRDPDIRRILRRGLSSVGFTGLYWATFLLLLMVSATVPGGVSAFLIAHSCCQLPVGLTAKPLSSAQLPRLAACFHEERLAEFRAIYDSGMRLALFVALPASLVMAALPETLARAVAFGTMGTAAGIALVGLCIVGMAIGAVGETMVAVATSASYARQDARSPVHAMALRLLVAGLAAIITQCAFSGTERMFMVGAALAAANLAAGVYLHWTQRRGLPETPGKRRNDLPADLAASVIAVLVAALVAVWLGGAAGPALRHIAVAAAALSASMVIYVLLQFARGSQELKLLLPVVGRWPGRRG